MDEPTDPAIEAAALSLAGGYDAPLKSWDDLALPPASGDHTRYIPAMAKHYREKARRAIAAYCAAVSR